MRRDLNNVKQSYNEQASQQLATVAQLSRASMANNWLAQFSRMFEEVREQRERDKR